MGLISVHKKKTEDIYLVTAGDLRMTDSRMLGRGGMSSTDSGVITSSGWVIFKNESTAAAFIIPLIELLKNVIAQVPYHTRGRAGYCYKTNAASRLCCGSYLLKQMTLLYDGDSEKSREDSAERRRVPGLSHLEKVCQGRKRGLTQLGQGKDSFSDF